MEKERQKKERKETDFQTPNMPTLCANNCGFFGNPATNNLCSKCYRDLSKSKAVEPVVPLAEREKENGGKEVEGRSVTSGIGANSNAGEEGRAVSTVAEQTHQSNRCSLCNKRVGLMGFRCRCGRVFCSVDRYSDKHGCPFDYKAAGRDAIAKANPVVKADKVEKI